MSDAPPPSGADQPRGGVFASFAHRPRMLIGAATIIVAYFLTPRDLREATRLLIAWNVGAWTFLVLIATMFASPKGSARKQAWLEDENQWVLLVLGLVASGAALAAIVSELGPVKDMTGALKAWHLALVLTSILSAWTFIQVMFTLHYAGVYFGRTHGKIRGGLQFPGTQEPGWMEFVYQAFAVGCTFASSDVNVTTPRMRRIVAIQGTVSFFFNTIILALAINIAAGFF
jgi:uncharacterized membrane protein